MNSKQNTKQQNLEISINLDTTPIIYTDNIFMTINEDGLVLDICQKLGPTNQIRIVNRIGMSREHAKKFVKKLNELLSQTEGKIQSGKVIIN